LLFQRVTIPVSTGYEQELGKGWNILWCLFMNQRFLVVVVVVVVFSSKLQICYRPYPHIWVQCFSITDSWITIDKLLSYFVWSWNWKKKKKGGEDELVRRILCTCWRGLFGEKPVRISERVLNSGISEWCGLFLKYGWLSGILMLKYSGGHAGLCASKISSTTCWPVW
jgi:hypothetical protein